MTENFTLQEFLASQTAARLGIANVPPPEAVEELRRLCTTVLQPLRDALGRPVIVSSGFRSTKLNRAVRGARESCHMAGRAADISVPGMTVRQVCHRIISLDLPVRQVIDEFGAWVHVSIEPAGIAPRRQMLLARRAANGHTVYTLASFKE